MLRIFASWYSRIAIFSSLILMHSSSFCLFIYFFGTVNTNLLPHFRSHPNMLCFLGVSTFVAMLLSLLLLFVLTSFLLLSLPHRTSCHVDSMLARISWQLPPFFVQSGAFSVALPFAFAFAPLHRFSTSFNSCLLAGHSLTALPLLFCTSVLFARLPALLTPPY